MNGTQAFEFLGNGGLWGFDRRYVGLDIMNISDMASGLT